MALRIGDSVVVKPGVLGPDIRMDVVIRCENENLNWELMTLETTDIEKTASRDSETYVRRATKVLEIA